MNGRKRRKEKVVFGKSNQKGDFYMHTVPMQEVSHLSLDACCFLLMGKCKFTPFTPFPGPDSKRCLAANVNSRRQEENHLTCYPQDTKHI